MFAPNSHLRHWKYWAPGGASRRCRDTKKDPDESGPCDITLCQAYRPISFFQLILYSAAPIASSIRTTA